MFALLAAALATLTASPAPEAAAAPDAPAPDAAAPEASILESATPWWERISVTLDDKGKQQSCRYETSSSAKAEACDKAMAESLPTTGKGQSGVFSKLTFERRFSPNGRVDGGKLQPGDTLLGRQVIFMTFDEKGGINSCHVVATAGDNPPAYDCDAARKEQFRAPVSARPDQRQAFMTILAYGHREQVV